MLGVSSEHAALEVRLGVSGESYLCAMVQHERSSGTAAGRGKEAIEL